MSQAGHNRLEALTEAIRSGLKRLRQETIEMGKRLAQLQSTTPADQWDACLANFMPGTNVWLDRQSAKELIDLAADPDIGPVPDDPAAVLADRIISFHVAQMGALFEKQEAAREADLKLRP